MAGRRKAGSGPDGPAKKGPPTQAGSAAPGKDTLGRAARKGRTGRKGRTSGKPKRTIGQRLRRAALYGVLGVVVLALIGAGAFAYMYHATKLPSANADFETQTSFVYYSNGDDKIGQFAVQNRDAISYDEMPQDIKDAVVAAENRSFWTDNGIDLKGIVRAAFSNASGNSTQGASTITQQYIKVLYLSQERSYTRKLKEAILSLKLQRQTSKKEILEGYLNTIYFGRGAYGIQAAAQAYFMEPASELTLKQAAVLASVLNNPSGFDPGSGTDLDKSKLKALKERYRYVLDGMQLAGNITAAEATKAEKRLPKFPAIPVESTYGGQKGHILTMVKNELKTLPNAADDGKPFTDDEIDGGGLRIKTTFTKKAMDAAEQGVLEARPDGFSDKQLHIGAASVQVGTGAVRGLYAGQDYLESQINWAIAGGQAGSSVKPFSLVAALKAGYSLKDTFDGNSPYTFDDGTTVVNEGTPPESYGSAVNLITALEKSINTAFTDLTVSMPDGPQKILDAMNALGIPKDKGPGKHDFGFPRASAGLDPYPSITLGPATISPINMASAYATIANGGRFAPPYIIESVTDADGKVLYDHTVSDKQVIDAKQGTDIADDVSYAMQQVVQSGTGTAALGIDRPAAGKTGTATNDKDQVDSAWFTGYTPQMATSVMYVRGKGNEQLDGWLPSYFGGDYPADTWTAIMNRDMQDVPVEDFPPPAYVDGEAPTTGHAPTYAPPPPPPSPTRKPTKSASVAPSKTPSARPTKRPTQEPTTAPPTIAPPTTEPPTSAPPTTAPPTTQAPTPTPTPSASTTAPAAGAAARTAFRRWARAF